MGPELKDLSSRVLKKIYLWAIESYFRSTVVLLIVLIVGVPLLGYLQDLVRYFPYGQVFNNLISWLKNNYTIRDYVYTLIIFLFALALLWLYRQTIKNNVISDYFRDGLAKWSWPLNSGWTVQECEDVAGHMLSVTNSHYPGTLKGASVWYDYEINFKAKLLSEGKSKIGLVVRSENSLNGVMLQITRSHLRPHLLYNGKYILDESIPLPTSLPIGSWEKFRIVVVGNNIELYIYNHIIRYSMPTRVLSVADEIYNIHGDLQLKDLEVSNKDIESKQNRAMRILDEIEKKTNQDDKKPLWTELDPVMKSIPKFTTITLEFQKGTVGFRASGVEKINVRDFLIRKIH